MKAFIAVAFASLMLFGASGIANADSLLKDLARTGSIVTTHGIYGR